MDHGLKHISFYVQKHIRSMSMCYNPALVRDKPLGAPTSVKLVIYLERCPNFAVFLNVSKGSIRKSVSDIRKSYEFLISEKSARISDIRK